MAVCDILLRHLLFQSHLRAHFVGAVARSARHHHIVLHIRCVIQHIIQGRRIERCPFEFNHIVLSSHKRCEAIGVTSASTRSHYTSCHIARAEAQERHSLYPQGSDHDFPKFSIFHGAIVLTNDLDYHEFWMHMTAISFGTFGKGCPHLCGGIGGKERHFGPSLCNALAQKIKLKISISETFANTDDAAHAGVAIVDAVCLGIVDES